MIEEFAERLYRAQADRVSTSPLSADAPDATIEDAYAIQMANVERSLAAGAVITGKKIGLTSKAMQDLLGVGEPDYGHLFDTMVSGQRGDGAGADGAVMSLESLLQPKVEAEIAFLLKEDIQGPNATVEDVLRATECVAPALEIVDSRVKDWKIKLFDTVADNASSGAYVLGGSVPFAPGAVDLPGESMVFFKNGEQIGSGDGTAVLGDPAYCVAWLANKLWAYGVTLKKGEVVLSGALSAAVDAQKGDVFSATFSTLGDVRVRFE
ncbi:MAG: 2-keto-4-pentenoate hydratase [Clostridiales Family XIII bacterium]|jgi:2-keto-4-pentenoate hydratase|nr:2-keto-4-pentenoate hydratase [Clostridiales Family XIII bacterium]